MSQFYHVKNNYWLIASGRILVVSSKVIRNPKLCSFLKKDTIHKQVNASEIKTVLCTKFYPKMLKLAPSLFSETLTIFQFKSILYIMF